MTDWKTTRLALIAFGGLVAGAAACGGAQPSPGAQPADAHASADGGRASEPSDTTSTERHSCGGDER